MPSKRAPSPADRRRYRRVHLDLSGRYVLPDRSEHRCRATDLSPGGICLVADVPPTPGQRVILYLDEIGRIEGVARRIDGSSFAMTITASSSSREELTARLIWLVNRRELALDDDRGDRRIALRNRQGELRLADGETLPVQILDLSCTGAAVRLGTRIELGARVALDGRAATVVRNLDYGHGLAFEQALTREEMNALAER